MDYHNTTIHQEDEESVSLISSLPVNTNEHEKKASHRPSTEPSDQFEFVSDVSSEMSHAEDIFFCGRLVPLQEQALSNDHIHKLSCKDGESKGFHRRQFSSLPASKTIDRSNSNINPRLVRTSRSMDSKKVCRDSSLRFETPNLVRALSDKSSEASDASGLIKVSKPRWYILMFGLVKFPQEMDLQDMKIRQTRRKPCQKASVNQNDGKSSWPDLLKMLSCKSHASVAVTASV